MEVKSIGSFFLRFRRSFLLFTLGGTALSLFAAPDEELIPVKTGRAMESLPSDLEEARGRARWLHEGFHGALQVMHRDFFDDDEAGTLPSQALDDVFAEMARSWSVEIRWLGVNATKGIDHHPKDRFEEKAAAALMSGEKEYEQVEDGRYRFVGMIRLQNECLKCHVRDRTTLEDRIAGLAISFPLKMQ